MSHCTNLRPRRSATPLLPDASVSGILRGIVLSALSIERLFRNSKPRPDCVPTPPGGIRHPHPGNRFRGRIRESPLPNQFQSVGTSLHFGVLSPSLSEKLTGARVPKPEFRTGFDPFNRTDRDRRYPGILRPVTVNCGSMEFAPQGPHTGLPGGTCLFGTTRNKRQPSFSGLTDPTILYLRGSHPNHPKCLGDLDLFLPPPLPPREAAFVSRGLDCVTWCRWVPVFVFFYQ